MGGRWAASRHVKSVRVCRPHPWAHPPHPGRGVGGVLQLHLRYLRNNSLRGASGSAARGDAGASAPPDPRAHGPRSRGHARAASRLPLALPPDCDLWILCDGRNRRRAERDGPQRRIRASLHSRRSSTDPQRAFMSPVRFETGAGHRGGCGQGPEAPKAAADIKAAGRQGGSRQGGACMPGIICGEGIHTHHTFALSPPPDFELSA